MIESIESPRHLVFDNRFGELITDNGKRIECSRRIKKNCSVQCPLCHYQTADGKNLKIFIVCGTVPVIFNNVEVSE